MDLDDITDALEVVLPSVFRFVGKRIMNGDDAQDIADLIDEMSDNIDSNRKSVDQMIEDRFGDE